MADGQVIKGASILSALTSSGIDFVVTVPDLWTCEGVLRPLPTHPSLRHIKVCKEDEGFGISAGLAACGKRSIIFMQCTGLLDSINALRVGVEFEQPVCMLVGLLHKEPDLAATESSQYIVRIVEPILDAMGVNHCMLETEDDVPLIKQTIDQAYERSRPAALLVGRRLRS